MVDQEISQHRAAEGSDERCHHRVSQGRAPLSQNRKCERFWTLPRAAGVAARVSLRPQAAARAACGCAAPRRRSCHCSASAVLVRCGADDRWAYSAQESVKFSNISATNRPLAFLSDDIGSLLKGGAKVCQRQLVNEVLVPFAIEFAHNLGREGATPIGSMPAAKWGVL